MRPMVTEDFLQEAAFKLKGEGSSKEMCVHVGPEWEAEECQKQRAGVGRKYMALGEVKGDQAARAHKSQKHCGKTQARLGSPRLCKPW